ncbi:hypothetical protein EJ06DRAFT_268209 [Trichodelitschia bisporula]|uniref:Uncharacterized protein n=1 Tax=Trichodelitschia bisporula TaxID=703511 RepID=A0A6G1HHU6_9PEZI|nr:hypothetical protein EJ06DRAFT_268209 [Trichodelitschia bisporula]
MDQGPAPLTRPRWLAVAIPPGALDPAGLSWALPRRAGPRSSTPEGTSLLPVAIICCENCSPAGRRGQNEGRGEDCTQNGSGARGHTQVVHLWRWDCGNCVRAENAASHSSPADHIVGDVQSGDEDCLNNTKEPPMRLKSQSPKR